MSHTGTAGLPEPGRYWGPGHSQEGKGATGPGGRAGGAAVSVRGAEGTG